MLVALRARGRPLTISPLRFAAHDQPEDAHEHVEKDRLLTISPLRSVAHDQPEDAHDHVKNHLEELTNDVLLIVLLELSQGSLVDVAAVSVTCRRFHDLCLANACALCAAQAEQLNAARGRVSAALEADPDPRAAPLAAVAVIAGGAGEPSRAYVRGLQSESGHCRVSSGAHCAHGLCTYRPLGLRARPGLAALLEAAADGTTPAAGVVAGALATILEAVGVPRLALARWLVLAEQPWGSSRAQLRCALYYHGGIRQIGVGRSSIGRAHAAASAFSKVLANPHANDDEKALAGTYLGSMHLDGLGVSQSTATARAFLTDAAHRGSQDAAEMLVELTSETWWPPDTRSI
ncbi:hypothetical protein T492DRAFT_1020822 [Pavlovales sp. CCMP2436]|nr:hypothetical protein T492DRAFT_1020822 [Pavlovales sp. CCMP2436]